MANKPQKRKTSEIKANPNIDWSKFDVEKFYETLASIIGKRLNLKIKVKFYKKSDLTKEEIEEMDRKNEEMYQRLSKKYENK